MPALKFTSADTYQDKAGTHLDLVVQNPAMARAFAAGMKAGRTYVAEVKEYRERRSLDANAYCWALIGKLAAALRQRKEDIYRQAIREIGDNFTIVPIRDEAVERWREIWSAKGLGWVSDILGPSKIQGYTNTVNYYGSSAYDARQMSCLIDALIAECKEQGIDTAAPAEISLMKEAWK